MVPLSPKSVLEGRNSDRTPLPFIIGLVVCGSCSLVALAYYVLTGGVGSTLLSGLLALPTVVVLVGLVLLIDRLEPEPRMLLVLAFAWGAGVAIVGSFIVNTFGSSLLVPVYGPDMAELLSSSVIAPVVEETFKGVFLLLLLLFRRFEIDGPTDALVYAALCALGFAFVENVLYYQDPLLSGEQVAPVVLMRGVISPLGHPIYTAMTGLGISHAATHRGFGRGVAVALGWFAAVLLHAMWNFSTAFGNGGLALAYLVELAVFIVLVTILLRDRRRLVALIGAYLPPYIPSGLVQQADLQMLGTMRGRKQARTWARSQSGLMGARAMSDYQLAATELALLHDHAVRATIPVDKFHERRNAILGLMRVARDAFFQRAPKVAAPPWTPQGEQSGFFRPLSNLETARLPIYQPSAQTRQLPTALSTTRLRTMRMSARRDWAGHSGGSAGSGAPGGGAAPGTPASGIGASGAGASGSGAPGAGTPGTGTPGNPGQANPAQGDPATSPGTTVPAGRSGTAPGGKPPTGQPPAGKPPAGQPQPGQPPAGQPPAGQPPANRPPGPPPGGPPPAGGRPPQPPAPGPQPDRQQRPPQNPPPQNPPSQHPPSR